MAHHFHSIEQPPQTEGLLIRWASYYDVAVTLTTLGQSRRLRKTTVDRALIQPGDTVLDVGCGTGEVTLLAKTRAKQGSVFGIDPAPEMIAVARKKAARKRLEIDFRVGVIEALPFPDSSIDVVTSSLMMHHLPEDLRVRGLSEVYRVLKPGGLLLIADFMRTTGSFLNHLYLPLIKHHKVGSVVEGLPGILKEVGFNQITNLDEKVLVIGFIRAVK